MTNNTPDDSKGNFFFDVSDADDCEDDTLDDRDDANDVDAKTANHLEASSVSLRDAFQAALTCNYSGGGDDLKHFFSSGFYFQC